MISEDVCYIGRGEKQYPFGNSRKKKEPKRKKKTGCFTPLFPSFLRLLSPAPFMFRSRLQHSEARQAMNAAMPYILWSAECRLPV